MRRIAVPTSAVLLFSLMFAAPTLAAAPINDTYPERAVIGALPYTATVDTTEATTDADDAELNDACGAPSTDASVWYEFTAASDLIVQVDAWASDYSTGTIVATGSPGAIESIEACGPGSVAFAAATGTTYAILVFDDQEDGGGNGGTLELSVAEAPPPPDVDITVDPLGTFNASTGSATISGTITCSADAFGFIDASVQQQVGRFAVRGWGFAELQCDGSTQPWSMEIVGDTGLFKGGRATVLVFGNACSFDCGFDSEEATIRLRR